MVSNAGSLAGAALTVGLLGVTVGVAGRVVSNTDRQLRSSQGRKRKTKNVRLRKAGIF